MKALLHALLHVLLKAVAVVAMAFTFLTVGLLVPTLTTGVVMTAIGTLIVFAIVALMPAVEVQPCTDAAA